MSKRRDFLRQASALLGVGTWSLPRFLQAQTWSPLDNSPEQGGNYLIVLQLSGGNDGLNTLVPYADEAYYQLRPKLALGSKTLHRLDGHQGFHPSLKHLAEAYHQGDLLILNNVGYPQPNRSHFRSMDIWHLACDSDDLRENRGWLGRWLDKQSPSFPHLALQLSDTLSPALRGEQSQALVIKDPQMMQEQLRHLPYPSSSTQQHHHEQAAYLYRVLAQAHESATYLLEKAKLGQSNISEYPNNSLGRDLRRVAQLMTGGSNTQVYYLSFDGFDTHANQLKRHALLLEGLDQALGVFIRDLKKNQLWPRTTLMIFSEFGRRVAENGSSGTDHGTANQVYLLGGGLKQKGIYNRMADLSQLEKGDLKFSIDFRSIYQALLKDWLNTKKSTALLGKNFDQLPLF